MEPQQKYRLGTISNIDLLILLAPFPDHCLLLPLCWTPIRTVNESSSRLCQAPMLTVEQSHSLLCVTPMWTVDFNCNLHCRAPMQTLNENQSLLCQTAINLYIKSHSAMPHTHANYRRSLVWHVGHPCGRSNNAVV